MDRAVVLFNTFLLLCIPPLVIHLMESIGKGPRSPRRTAFIAFVSAVIGVNLGFLYFFDLQRYVPWIPALYLLPLLLCTLLTSRYRGVKPLFLYLTGLIWATPSLQGAQVLALLAGQHALVKTAGILLFGAPMILLMKCSFQEPLQYLLENHPKGWLLFCAIPLVTAVASVSQTQLRFLHDPQAYRISGVWQMSLALLAFLTYLLILRFSRQIRNRLEADGAHRLLAAQHQGALTHIAALRQNQEQAAVSLHDLRHHLRYVRALAQEGSVDGIIAYVTQVQQSVESLTPLEYCKNEPVNLLLSFFHAQAQKADVRLLARADVPASLSIPDADLCVVLSNALENAIKAAREVADRPRDVSCALYLRNEQLFLEVVNPYAGEIKTQSGALAPGQGGLGTRSIGLLAKKHGGLVHIDASMGTFTLRVIL